MSLFVELIDALKEIRTAIDRNTRALIFCTRATICRDPWNPKIDNILNEISDSCQDKNKEAAK